MGFRLLIILLSTNVFADIFPVQKLYHFLNFSSPDLYFNLSDTQLCSENQVNENGCCSCHPSCLTFRTCCIDYLWNKRPTWNSLDEYLDYFLEKIDRKKQFSCLPVVQNVKASDLVENILIVSLHPNSTEQDFQPVVGDDNLVYYSPTTAAWHGVTKTRLLNLSITCNYVNSTAGLLTTNNCHYMVKVENKPNQHFQSCDFRPVKNTCPNSNSRDSLLCAGYQGTISKSNIPFRNVHCLKCRGDSLNGLSVNSCPKRPEEIMRYSIVISYSEKAMYAYDKDGNKLKIEMHCDPDELYDFNTGSCKKFRCAYGYEKTGFTCIRTHKNSNSSSGIGQLDSLDTRLTKCMLSKSFPGANIILRYFNECEVCESLKMKFPSNHIIGKFEDYSFVQYTIRTLDDLRTLDNLLMKFSSLVGKTVLNVSSENNFQTSILHGFDLSRTFPNAKQCFQSQEQNISSIWINEFCSVTADNTTFYKDDFIIWLHYSYINSSSILKKFHVATCKQFYLSANCPLQHFSTQDYIINNDSTITVLKETEQVYNVSDYIPLNDGVGVCLENYATARSAKPDWLQSTQDIEEYVTLIGTVVSAFCYFIIIFTYLCFKELKTIPSLNITSLCTVLFLSDLLVLSTIFIKTRSTTCKIIAVSLHWSLLTVQIWTVIISLEVWLTLRKNTSSRFGRSFKRFYCYCVIAFSVPTLVIIITTIFDFRNILFIGYGLSSSGCWIGSNYGRVVLYIIPVILVACFDTTILIWVIAKIHKQQTISKQLLSKSSSSSSDKNLAKTALKLIVILGCVEVIGFVQIPNPTSDSSLAFNAAMSFLFTFLRSFRGFLIWLLYICLNKRVWSHYPCFKNSSLDSPVLLTKSSRIASMKHAVSLREAKV